MSTHESTHVIANPVSGSDRTRRQSVRRAAQVARSTSRRDIAWTRHPGHATVLAREALRDGADTLVVVGGDGTLNEVVNGFFDEQGHVVSDALLIPAGGGTGGDFRRTLKEMSSAADVPFPVDVIRVTYHDSDGQTRTRYALNIVSAGLGGLVVRLVQRMQRVLRRGRLAYFAAIVSSLPQYDHDEVRVIADGHDLGTHRIRNVAVANGRYFGGGLKIAPSANITDGALDLVLLDDVPFSRLLRDVRAIYAGDHRNLPYLRHIRARSVMLEPRSPGPVYLDIDGEGIGQLPATLDVVPSAIRLAPLENLSAT